MLTIIIFQILLLLCNSTHIGFPEEFGHMVSIRDAKVDKNVCTGAIVGYNHVLTATFCLKHNNITKDNILVVGGQSNPNLDYSYKTVRKLYINKDANLSILKLKKPFDSDHLYISKIPIVFEDLPKKKCIIVRWNQTESVMTKSYDFINLEDWDKKNFSGEHIICNGHLVAIKCDRSGEYISLDNYSRWISSKIIRGKFNNNFEIPYASFIFLMLALIFCWLMSNTNQNRPFIELPIIMPEIRTLEQIIQNTIGLSAVNMKKVLKMLKRSQVVEKKIITLELSAEEVSKLQLKYKMEGTELLEYLQRTIMKDLMSEAQCNTHIDNNGSNNDIIVYTKNEEPYLSQIKEEEEEGTELPFAESSIQDLKKKQAYDSELEALAAKEEALTKLAIFEGKEDNEKLDQRLLDKVGSTIIPPSPPKLGMGLPPPPMSGVSLAKFAIVEGREYPMSQYIEELDQSLVGSAMIPPPPPMPPPQRHPSSFLLPHDLKPKRKWEKKVNWKAISPQNLTEKSFLTELEAFMFPGLKQEVGLEVEVARLSCRPLEENHTEEKRRLNDNVKYEEYRAEIMQLIEAQQNENIKRELLKIVMEKFQKTEESLDILRKENDAIRKEIDEKNTRIRELDHCTEVKEIGYKERMAAAHEEIARLREENDSLITSRSDANSYQEVELLRTVLEFKQQELSELRKATDEAAQKADQLSEFEEKVAVLTAKCEDLQHQLKRKNEDELQLQELYKKEANQNKRLYQYNEELQWKIHQNFEVVTKILQEDKDAVDYVLKVDESPETRRRVKSAPFIQNTRTMSPEKRRSPWRP